MKPYESYQCIRCLMDDWRAENPEGGTLRLPPGSWGFCSDHKGAEIMPDHIKPYRVVGAGYRKGVIRRDGN